MKTPRATLEGVKTVLRESVADMDELSDKLRLQAEILKMQRLGLRMTLGDRGGVGE